MYQSAVPEQSKECVWKEESVWIVAERLDDSFYSECFQKLKNASVPIHGTKA